MTWMVLRGGMTAVFIAIAVAGLPSSASDSELRTSGNETTSQRSMDQDVYRISASAIGRIRLETTLDQARRLLPGAKFRRVSDGDGAALVEVTLKPDVSMIIWADEDDPDSPIAWSKRIKTIETFSPAFHTVERVHPGSLVRDVENVFGKTKEITKSEIESREYIVFERQPAYLTFRLDYTGIFATGSRKTTEFNAGAKIYSIAVSSYWTK
jgi:hypothetical protein